MKKFKPYTPVPRGARAACWKLAVIDPADENWVICQVEDCPDKRVGRGSLQGAKFSTQNITHHMETKHPDEFAPYLQAAKECEALKKTSEVKVQTHLKFSRKNPCIK